MISFIVPGLNEKDNIISTIIEIENSCKISKLLEYEILFVDDGSTDGSSLEVEKYESEFKKNIKIIKNEKNYGYGASIKIGASSATKKNICWVPADNSHPSKEIAKLISSINKFDIISTYYSNSNERDPFRKKFTSLYTPILNFIFNEKIPYYNGVTIIKKEIFINCNIQTGSHAFQLEMWSNIFLQKNNSITFIPTLLTDRIEGATAFKFNNSVKVVFTTLRVIFLFFIKKALSLLNK